MSVKNIIITNVNQQTTAEYIADVLWKQEICKVSSISLVHEIRNDNVSLIAYVEIDSFCETEAAYEFVYNMTADCSVFCHDEDDLENMDKYWFLKKDTNKYGKTCATRYNTTTFTPEFFTHDIVEAGSEFVGIDPNWDEPADEKDLTLPGEVLSEKMSDIVLTFSDKITHTSRLNSYDEEENYTYNSEEWEEFNRRRPIKSRDNIYYTVEEALEYLWRINKQFERDLSLEDRFKLEDEMLHIEEQLKNWQEKIGLDPSQQPEMERMVSMAELCPALFVPKSHKMKREVAMNMDEFDLSPLPLSADNQPIREQYMN